MAAGLAGMVPKVREDVVDSWAPYDSRAAREIIESRRATPGAALPILHDLQLRFGYIDDEAAALMADALNISRAEALGIVTFYPDFHRRPVKGRELKLCRAESCQARGCEDLVAHLEARHGLAPDQPDPNGALRVETVYCLGHCALSPAALLDGEPIGRLDRDRLDTIVSEARAQPTGRSA
jgi:formate dehydrogenase subunit gamma